MGRREYWRIRKTKLVLPLKSYLVTVLSNVWRLQGSAIFIRVHVRRYMTSEKRQRGYKLRLECKERYEQLVSRVSVAYRGELRRTEHLPGRRGSSSIEHGRVSLGLKCYLLNSCVLVNKLH